MRNILPLSLLQNGRIFQKTIDSNGHKMYDFSLKTHASVAQLDRASVFGTEG